MNSLLAISLILLYIVYKWEDINRLKFISAILNKQKATDNMILPRFLLVVLIAILIQMYMNHVLG